MSQRPLLCWILTLAMCIATGTAAADNVRQRTRIDDGWRFALGHAWDPAKDFDHGMRAFFFGKAGFGDGPAAADFEDRPWRRVDLPHDWAWSWLSPTPRRRPADVPGALTFRRTGPATSSR